MPKIRVAVLVGEFFEGSLEYHGGFGGYGMLARHYIAKYLPDSEIEIETILGFNHRSQLEVTVLDGSKKVILLPPLGTGGRLARFGPIRNIRGMFDRRSLRRFLNSFDVFLGIETMPYNQQVLELVERKKLVLYIQDPRPQSEWTELDSVIRTDDGSPRPNPLVCAFYRRLVQQDRLAAISQGVDLVKKARDLYDLPQGFPIRLVRNPVEFEDDYDLQSQVKVNAVLFLGRLDPVKRPWLAMEVAKRMPDVQFYFLGRAHDEVVPYILHSYQHLPNVRLLGHQSGSIKTELLKKCKILINPSIHEAIPVSFLEALAYGTLIVSCQNPDSLTERFGAFTGKILGDGRDQAELFVKAIRQILVDEPRRAELAERARAYVKQHHNIEAWVKLMREVLRHAAYS
jgi:glycosyltransferase involved in cell wall biosynthesis